jgi:hypothetical protein
MYLFIILVFLLAIYFIGFAFLAYKKKRVALSYGLGIAGASHTFLGSGCAIYYILGFPNPNDFLVAVTLFSLVASIFVIAVYLKRLWQIDRLASKP